MTDIFKNPLVKERYDKLVKIKALGFHPYPESFQRTHFSTEAQTLAKKGLRSHDDVLTKNKMNVTLAGRILSIRSFGKLTFMHLLDGAGKIQIAFAQSALSKKEEALKELLDIGDFIGVTGELFNTKHGELTLLVGKLTFLGKALRPLPEKWHGLQNQEARYRQRYLDMVSNVDVRDRFVFRSRLTQKLREFYNQRGFLEIETPILECVSGGATAKPFITHHNALDIDVYLHLTSGELWQKMAIAGGFEKTFEVSKCFRNEGMDPSHLQEFTMIEHYAAYWNFEDGMRFTEEMLEWVLKEILGTTKVTIKDRDGNSVEVDFKAPWPRKNYAELIKADCGIDILEYKDGPSLLKAIEAKKIMIEDAKTMAYGNLVDHLYKKVTRPKLIQPTFVIRHPLDTKPLARKSDVDPRLCDSYQLLLGTWEIVNAYSELVDPVDQRERFERQSKAKAGGDEDAMELDEDFLTAMEHGMPPIAGWGMGIDRLAAILTGQENLRDVVLFPLMRPSHVISTEVRSAATNKAEKSLARDASATVGMTTELTDDQKNIKVGISFADAEKLLVQHMTSVPMLNHSRESAAVMRVLAKRFGADEESWAVLGLLHDIDWDPEKGGAETHGIHCEAILKAAGVTPEAIQVIKSHVFGLQGYNHPFEGMARTRFIEHALACGETVTGLIHAGTLVRPDKKVASMEVSSLKKKFKDKTFARGADRNVMKECEKCGLTLDEFLGLALEAVKGVAEQVGL